MRRPTDGSDWCDPVPRQWNLVVVYLAADSFHGDLKMLTSRSRLLPAASPPFRRLTLVATKKVAAASFVLINIIETEMLAAGLIRVEV